MTKDVEVVERSVIPGGLFTIVFVVFLVLKLGGWGVVANWSWWWVTAPLWGPLAAFIIVVVVIAVIAAIAALVQSSRGK